MTEKFSSTGQRKEKKTESRKTKGTKTAKQDIYVHKSIPNTTPVGPEDYKFQKDALLVKKQH